MSRNATINLMQIDPETMAKRKKLQMEIMLKDSDLKRNERAMMEAEIAIRDLRHKQAQLQMEYALKENLVKKLGGDHIQLQAELIKMRHQMNALR